jgi:hypothetical protein
LIGIEDIEALGLEPKAGKTKTGTTTTNTMRPKTATLRK